MDSLKDHYGITRRRYYHRTAQAAKAANKYNYTREDQLLQPQEQDQEQEQERERYLPKILEDDCGGGDDNTVLTIMTANSNNTKAQARSNAITKAMDRKAKTKEAAVKQAKRRKKILRRIFEANTDLNQKDKSDAKNARSRRTVTAMLEVHQLIKTGLLESAKDLAAVAAGSNSNGIITFDVGHIVATPAIELQASIYGDSVDANDIGLREMTSSEMNPAATQYFFVREVRDRDRVRD